jgi:hypothetical protein
LAYIKRSKTPWEAPAAIAGEGDRPVSADPEGKGIDGHQDC